MQHETWNGYRPIHKTIATLLGKIDPGTMKNASKIKSLKAALECLEGISYVCNPSSTDNAASYCNSDHSIKPLNALQYWERFYFRRKD